MTMQESLDAMQQTMKLFKDSGYLELICICCTKEGLQKMVYYNSITNTLSEPFPDATEKLFVFPNFEKPIKLCYIVNEE